MGGISRGCRLEEIVEGRHVQGYCVNDHESDPAARGGVADLSLMQNREDAREMSRRPETAHKAIGLERPGVVALVCGALLAVFAATSWLGARGKCATFDEPMHA